jgi:hypothetical protein
MGLLERIKEGGPSHKEKMDELQHLFPQDKGMVGLVVDGGRLWYTFSVSTHNTQRWR